MQPDKSMIEVLKLMASPDQERATAARRAFAQMLQSPLRKAVFDANRLGDIFEVQVLEPGTTASYPFDLVRPGDEDHFAAFTIAQQGRLPERRVEASEIQVPTYRVGNAIDWDLRFMKHARFDVVKRAMEVFGAGFVRKLNSDGFRCLLAAAADRGLVVEASGTAPLTGSASCISTPPAPGEFTKELVSRMHTAMTRAAGGNGNGGRLTDLYLSLEAMECIRAWDATRLDEFTRRQVFVSPEKGLASIYGVMLHPMTEFGIGQEYQDFLVNVMGQALPVNTAEFCLGLDLSNRDSFVMPVAEELSIYTDEALLRQQRMGVYGWLELGIACLDNRRVLLGAF